MLDLQSINSFYYKLLKILEMLKFNLKKTWSSILISVLVLIIDAQCSKKDKRAKSNCDTYAHFKSNVGMLDYIVIIFITF